MFRNGRNKPGKSQINGRHKPQMLAAKQRQLAKQKTAQKQKRKIPPKNLSAHEPHININLSNISIPTLFLLLIVMPQVLADANMQRLIISGIKVHDKPVELLPREAKCLPNSRGVSRGDICTFGGTTHYLKPLKTNVSNKNDDLCYQVFNQQLAESTIGIKTATFRFFKRTPDEPTIYIASEHVKDVKFVPKKNGVNKLKSADIAKWAAASTFIYDLHANNVGYTNEGIVALDLDGHNRPLTNDFFTNMMTAAHTINAHTPSLSIDNIKQLKQIYIEMQSKPLPEHHDSFHLTDEMYQKMLNAYIDICDKVIAADKTAILVHEDFRPSSKINQLWCQTAKDYIVLSSQPDDKFYNNLCVEKPPKNDGFFAKANPNGIYGKSKPVNAKLHFKKNRKDAEE